MSFIKGLDALRSVEGIEQTIAVGNDHTPSHDYDTALLFHSTIRPRGGSDVISYQEITKVFNHQLIHEQSSLFITGPQSENEGNYNYQPIFGYESLSGNENYSKQKYTLYEVESRLEQLRRAIREWDLIMVRKIIDSDEFDEYLDCVSKSDELSDAFKRRIIKRMIVEQIGSLSQPLRNEGDVRQKELNLIILLNSL